MRCCFDNFVPQADFFNPEYFAAAVSSYLALGVIALFTSVPKRGAGLCRARSFLYIYATRIVHIVPMTVGLRELFRAQAFSAPDLSGSL